MKVLLFSLLIFQVFSQCPYLFQAQAPGFPTGFCYEQCTNPLYKNCPPRVIISTPSPEYCGLHANGTWLNFTLTCQACQTPSVKGYYFGKCSCNLMTCPAGTVCVGGNCQTAPSCDVSGCPSGLLCVNSACTAPQCSTTNPCPTGKVCDNGFCRVATCADITCTNPLQTCQFGVCYRKYDTFCSAQQPRIVRNYCQIPRPTTSNCPNIAVPTSNPAFCGVLNTGQLVSFDRKCEACKRAYIQYVYDMPCQQVPKPCPSNQICTNGVCTNPANTCGGVICSQYAQCVNNVCVNIPNYCVSQSDCPPANTCSRNRCIPNANLCAGNMCQANQICVQNACLNSCVANTCQSGWTCNSGLCYPIPGYCINDLGCGANQKCISNICQNLPNPIPDPNDCTYKNCGIGALCIQGICIPLNPYPTPNPNPTPTPNPSPYPKPHPDHGDKRPYPYPYPYPYPSPSPYPDTRYCDQFTNCGIAQTCVNGVCAPISTPIPPVVPTRCPYIPCPTGSDCINGLCQTSAFGRSCSTSIQCNQNQICLGNYCRVYACYTNADCFGYACSAGYCRS